MPSNTTIALCAWALTASVAVAQIPRDPLAESTPQPAGAPPGATAPPFITKQNDVEIPFNVRPGSTPETQPTSVRVFVSWDRGKSWHFYEEKRPEEAKFRFRAKQDGEFWFATQTIDRAGRPDSAEPRSPQLRLIIDTQRPQLLVQTQVDNASNVNLTWSAADANLIPTSLKVEYQDASGTGGAWQAVELAPAKSTVPGVLNGQVTIHPTVSGCLVNIRAEIADSAGNMGYYSQKLSLTPPKANGGSGLAYSPPPDPSATHWPTANATPGGVSNSQLAAADTGAREGEQVQIPNVVSNPFVGPGRLTSARQSSENLPPPSPASGSTTLEAWRPSQQATIGADPLPPASQQTTALPADAQLDATANTASPVFESLPGPAATPSAAPDLAPPLAHPVETLPVGPTAEQIEPATAQRPRLTNSRRFSLEYDIQSVGPEGVSAVELWGTTDGGRTWSKWGQDPDRASPFDVEVNHEAVYGFRIVVVGKNGLATTTPQAGDAADIWVGVDLTRPNAKLTGAVYGQGDAAGKLDIRWQADDPHLGGRPVTILLGDRPDGPFTPIAAGLPNSGQYYWEYDPRSPRQIYLRLEVRDDAGNIAIDQLTDPIKVEGLEPKGQIRGFQPRGETSRGGAFRSPLFR